MWSVTTRAQHRREGLRFPSDLTDAEGAPLLPPPSPAGRLADAGKKINGRKRHALLDTDGRPLVL